MYIPTKNTLLLFQFQNLIVSVQERVCLILVVFIEINLKYFKIDFWGMGLGLLDRIPQIPLDLMSPAMDFHEKVEL